MYRDLVLINGTINRRWLLAVKSATFLFFFLSFLLESSSSSEPTLRRACTLVDKVSDESLTHSMQIMWRIFVRLNCLSFSPHLLPFSFLKSWKKICDLHSVYFVMKNYLFTDYSFIYKKFYVYIGQIIF